MRYVNPDDPLALLQIINHGVVDKCEILCYHDALKLEIVMQNPLDKLDLRINMKQAVCVVIKNKYGRYLAVSRRNDLTQWGFPGGKVDPGESNIEAATREIYEEIGISVCDENLIPIYTGICLGKDGCNFWATTYFLSREVDPGLDDYTPEEDISITWMDNYALTHPDHSPFAHYNREIFKSLSIMESYA